MAKQIDNSLYYSQSCIAFSCVSIYKKKKNKIGLVERKKQQKKKGIKTTETIILIVESVIKEKKERILISKRDVDAEKCVCLTICRNKISPK